MQQAINEGGLKDCDGFIFISQGEAGNRRGRSWEQLLSVGKLCKWRFTLGCKPAKKAHQDQYSNL